MEGLLVIGLICVLAFVGYKFVSGETDSSGNTVTANSSGTVSNPISVANAVVNAYLQMAQMNSNSVNSMNNPNVNYYDILAVICQESGASVLKGLDSSTIMGDNLSAFGIMQIHQGALTQVNNMLGTNYQTSDLQNDATNILVGATYLQYCMQRASLNQANAYACYNSGSPSGDSNYSNSVIAFYNQLLTIC
jgi:soluble lytic murein transglycosylase-like protein